MAAGGVDSTERKKDSMMTRNFLGVCPIREIAHEELDLSLEVKSEWKTHIMSNDCTLGTPSAPQVPALHPSGLSSNLNLHLSSVVGTAFGASSPSYHSVCTLEKVKSALERAEKEKQQQQKPDVELHVGSPSSSSSSSITTSGSTVKRNMEGEEESHSSGSLMAAGCPSCLMYVLISKGNPKCPRCESYVPLTKHLGNMKANKKPRIDLNFASQHDEELN